ncbi:LOW QUALITY PROTEIN: galactose-3-O-sulfotransferase 2-like [Scyliorhinus canicula]|uniref:LOW QUALITY PROTEIN: galactose-3-O-sulfotransferase 2-like n=1 Tax=Scyliorhinus canicula TaxID=7830 RepID=UPI0018F4B8F7|nr:LOW QUALITY PROTEIN: galactose-3-O-sulfotransferase 2-like [Scyliorhinus canicula]
MNITILGETRMGYPQKTRTLQLFLIFIVITSFSLTIRTIYSFARRRYGITLGPTCTPKKHVVFLKTHKTASSTVLNILYRYGESRNLTFALPMHDHLGYPQRFRAEFVRDFATNRDKEHHIICNHMRFNLPEVRRVMPNGSFYFSIVRNPVRLAESSFAYYHSVSPAFKRAASLDEFVSHADSYYRSQELNSHYTRNLMWFDFGYDSNAMAVPGFNVSTALGELERTFDLILVAEHFDESMVLLREALCWELEDVVYFKLNARSGASVSSLNATAADRVRAWNRLDWELYRHFNASFWQRVATYGHQRMQQDLGRLRELRRRLTATCLQGGAPVEGERVTNKALRPYNSGDAKILGYILRANLSRNVRELCQRMVLPERYHLHHLQKKQSPLPPVTPRAGGQRWKIPLEARRS